MSSLWLAPEELRVGLGCMRLSTDADRDAVRSAKTIAAAAEAGITVFDTARAYAVDETELGHNERLLAHTLRADGVHRRARIVTKGGMTRANGAWVPDGRAKAIRADCESSLAALDGLPIDLYLLHAPDPRTPWRTSLRALARIVDDGLVARVGVANVNRDQLDEALELAPIAAVQGALSPLDDHVFRSGVFERCSERGLAFIAHSPLGGPRRTRRLERVEALASIAQRHGATAAETSLAWLLALAPNVVAVPGARRPDAAISAAGAARITLDDDERRELDQALGRTTSRQRRRASSGTEVVLVMGIPGAGKSTLAEEYLARDYTRLNRDEFGGTLRDLSEDLARQLAAGASRLVLENTYLTRAGRSRVVEAARAHGAEVRCIWLDTPLAQAHRSTSSPACSASSIHSPSRGSSRSSRRRTRECSRRRRRCVRGESSSPRRRTRDGQSCSGRRSRGRRDPRPAWPACSWRPPPWPCPAGGTRSTPVRRALSSTGDRAAIPARSPPRSPSSRRRAPAPWRARCAPTPADRRAAGAGRRCPGCRWRSRERTASSRPDPSSSA